MEALPTQRLGEVIAAAVERLVSQAFAKLETLAPRASLQLPPLQVGQLVTADVAEQLSPGRYRIAVQGTLVEAIAPEGLQPGEELALRVTQLQPGVVFQLLAQGQSLEAAVLDLLRTHLPNDVAAGESWQALQQQLGQVAKALLRDGAVSSLDTLQSLLPHLVPDDAPPTAEHIRAFVRDGGLHYEAKLLQLADRSPPTLARIVDSDLKGLLLRALKAMEGAPASSHAPGLATALRHHLDHIETQQALNLLAQVREEPYRLQIPFWTGHNLATAFLAVEPDAREGNGEKAGEGRGHHVLFFLDLDGFGQTRIDAHVTPHALRVIFYVDHSSALTVLRSELPAFQDTLRALGYREVLIAAKPLAGLSPERRRRLDALPTAVPTGVGLVDVKV
jgi:hypothetical protein